MYQALKRRNEKLEIQNAALKLTFDRMLSDIEMTESAGCAFALELGWIEEHGTPAISELIRSWEAALEAGANFQEARKWLRDTLKKDKTFFNTAIEAAGKNPNMDLETPFGSFNLRTLTKT